MIHIQIIDDKFIDRTTSSRPKHLGDLLLACKNNLLDLDIDVRKYVFLEGQQSDRCQEEGYNTTCLSCDLLMTKTEENANDHLVIFIHVSNTCFTGFIRHFLNKQNCLIVCFSGGGTTSKAFSIYKNLKEANPGCENIIYKGLAPEVRPQDIKKIWNLEAFLQAIDQKKSEPFSYLEKQSKPYLTALFILCLGYMAAYNSDKLSDNLKTLVPEGCSEKIGSKDWWTIVLGSKDNVERDLTQDCPDILNLLNAIYVSRNSLENPEFLQLVEKAYGAMNGCLST